MTPLFYAASAGHLSAVITLVNAGANINAACKGGTPLHVAAVNGRAEVVRFLLSKHADARILNTDEETALQVAVKQKQSAVLKVFKLYGIER
jgi:ankyrin repeat protein